MFNLKRLLIALAIVASIITAAGCSSSQTAVPDQANPQSGTEQTTPQTQTSPQTQASYQDVGGAQAKQLIDSDSTLQIVDVRSPEEFAEGHIQGAKLIPIDELTARMGEIDKTKPVFVYCLSGARSAQAAQVLVQSGYSKVYNLTNGINDWSYGLVK